MKRTPLRRPRRKPAGAIMADLWRDGLGPCAMRGTTACSGPLQGHHVIEKRALRRRGLDEHLWDKRNRMSLCDHHHAQHTVAHKRIPYDLVPASALEFADELGLTYLIERYYPREEAA